MTSVSDVYLNVFGMAVMPLLCRGFAKKSCKSHTENAKLGRKYGFLYLSSNILYHTKGHEICPENRKNTKNLGGKKIHQEIYW